jgi:hypothetical protein
MKQPRKPLTFDIDSSPVTEAEISRASDTPVPLKPPAVSRQQLGVRIPVDIYKRLRIKAFQDGVLVQDLVERAVAELLEREGA